MTEKFITALGNCIFSHIEKGFVVVGPDDAGNTFNSLWKEFTSSQIFYVQKILSIARVIGAVGEQVSVIAGDEVAYAHELLTLGQFIHVNQDFLRSVGTAFL